MLYSLPLTSLNVYVGPIGQNNDPAITAFLTAARNSPLSATLQRFDSFYSQWSAANIRPLAEVFPLLTHLPAPIYLDSSDVIDAIRSFTNLTAQTMELKGKMCHSGSVDRLLSALKALPNRHVFTSVKREFGGEWSVQQWNEFGIAFSHITFLQLHHCERLPSLRF